MALDPNLTFFTSDQHFGSSWRKKTDQFLIDSWNSVVPPGGTVCFIGDFTDGRDGGKGKDYIFDILSKLNGNVMFIFGNHDDNISVSELTKHNKVVWAGVRRRISVKDPEGNVQRVENESYQEIVIDHFPIRAWEKKTFGSWHLYGHMHGTTKPHDLSFDVGVDVHDFKPWSYAQVKAKMARLREKNNLKVKKEVRTYQ